MPKQQEQSASRMKAADYEKLGRMIEQVYATAYADKKRLLVVSFLQGIARGLGAVLGATIVVALLLWILSLIGEVPFVGPLIDNVRETVEQQ